MSLKVCCEVHALSGLASTFDARSSRLRPGGTTLLSGGTDPDVVMRSCRHLLLAPGEGGSIAPLAQHHDGDLACRGYGGLLEPLARGELHPPCLERR